MSGNVVPTASNPIGTVLGLFAVAALVAATAFFVALEFAVVAVDRTEVESRAAKGDKGARSVLKLLTRLSYNLSGVQLGITLCSVVLGLLAEPTIGALVSPILRPLIGETAAGGISIALAIFLATALQLVIGELIPKSIAVAKPFDVSLRLARPAAVYGTVFKPAILLFGGVADWIVRRLGLEPAEELKQVRSRHELAAVLNSSQEEGTLQAGEVNLLRRALRFGEKTAAEALTPRTDITAISRSSVVPELVELSINTGLSRFPVINDTLDDVVGVVHVKTIFGIEQSQRETTLIRDIVEEAVFVPETRLLDELMLDMRVQAAYMAIVLDEYGGTAGIITLEDMLEEIVGEIDDEHDRTRHRRPIWKIDGNVVLAGRLHPDDVLDAIGLEIPEGEYETIGGFVMAELGKIPERDDEFTYDGWTVAVESMDKFRVDLVRLKPPEFSVGDQQ